MIRKSLIAVLIGTAVFMTACSGSGTKTTGNDISESWTESELSEAVNNVTVIDGDAFEETVDEVGFVMPETEEELNDGILTIRLDGGNPKDGFSWSYCRGDKGDATLVQCLTDTTEDGCLYAGSFRALEDSGDGKDYIRLVYSNDVYTHSYIDIDVEIKDSTIESYMITEMNPLDQETLASLIEGSWQQENDGAIFMDITQNPVDGFDIVISDGSGADDSAVYNTMTAYFDILKEAMVYDNGAFILNFDENTSDVAVIEWIDMTDSHDPIRFVKK